MEEQNGVSDVLRPVQNNGVTTKPGGITGKGFMPGQSGNPGGRPKKNPLTAALVELMASPLPKERCAKLGLEFGQLTYAHAYAVTLWNQMLDGSIRAAKEIADRIEGRPLQKVELNEQPLTHEEMKAQVVGHFIHVLAERSRIYNQPLPELVELADEAGVDLDIPRPGQPGANDAIGSAAVEKADKRTQSNGSNGNAPVA